MSKKSIEPLIIRFADNLAQVLPKDYTHNLALLPLEQRQAINEDLRRWHLAETMFEKRRIASGVFAITDANKLIIQGISILEPETYRNDMRRRLNILKGALK